MCRKAGSHGPLICPLLTEIVRGAGKLTAQYKGNFYFSIKRGIAFNWKVEARGHFSFRWNKDKDREKSNCILGNIPGTEHDWSVSSMRLVVDEVVRPEPESLESVDNGEILELVFREVLYKS